MKTQKNVNQIVIAAAPHMVGDGFRVQSTLPGGTRSENNRISPFIMLDYSAPNYIPPAPQPKGVGEHPHKGFETVTIVYQGELEHRDSTGSHGKLFPGDVQWMTAGAGILHEEKFSEDFTKLGGKAEFAQLWVNLPKANKNTPPAYQNLTKADIPVVSAGNGSSVRVIAGNYNDVKGAASTFSPVNVWDVHIKAGDELSFSIPANFNTATVVMQGAVKINGAEVKAVQTALFDQSGTEISIVATQDTNLLLLSGEPINEPIFAYGPFVMNTEEEIITAINDYNAGKWGSL
ncbi:pirin family protein [Chitinophaga silvatica]|uniref:Pirin family protein n=1 Tax=Chitinophaga silvatica TaxID=2282649 RepID=A0A3E1YA36_9BACT|nr:pirin family protein [Chitinophaga silvatica]RFS22527.1 pirin family protein [Chitinophaga silvatica]